MTDSQYYLRTQLNLALRAKRKRHSLYSLRAFARDLKLSPGRLSGFLNGKHSLSTFNHDRLIEHLLEKNSKTPELFWSNLLMKIESKIELSKSLIEKLSNRSLIVSRQNGQSWLHEFLPTEGGLICKRFCPEERVQSTQKISCLGMCALGAKILKIDWGDASFHLIYITKDFWLGLPTQGFYSKRSKKDALREIRYLL